MGMNHQRMEVIGNMTDNPEYRVTPGGTPVCNFSVAVNESWRDKVTGQKKETVEYIPCVVWGKAAEAVAQYCGKGRQVRIVGKMKTRRWEDKEGNKRSRMELTATEPVGFGQEPRSRRGQVSEPINDASEDIDFDGDDGYIPPM